MKRGWGLWFACFLLLAWGWALFTPVDQYPDEADHVAVAVSVVRGEVAPRIGPYTHNSGAVTEVPKSILRAYFDGPCNGLDAGIGCAASPTDPDTVTVVTSEGRNFPLYYLMVGWPSLVASGTHAWLLMRLASGTLCALFMASALTVLFSLRVRPLILAAAVVVGLTPLAVDLMGSVNPSGLEASSAMCWWAVLLALRGEEGNFRRRTLGALGAVTVVVLATCRNTGVYWTVLIAAVVFLASSPAERRRMVGGTPLRYVLGVFVVVGGVVEWWIIRFKASDRFPVRNAPHGVIAAVRASFDQLPKMVEEVFAYLGWLTVRPPASGLWLWAAGTALILLVAWSLSARTGAMALLAVGIVLLGPQLILAFAYAHPALGIWQGRYTLPLVVGVLVPVVVGAPAPRQVSRADRAGAAVIALVIAAHVSVYVGAMDAFGRDGHHWYNTAGQALLAVGALAFVAALVRLQLLWLRKSEQGTGPVLPPSELAAAPAYKGDPARR